MHGLKEAAKLFMACPDSVGKDAGKALDRAIRCCRGVVDTDPFFARWHACAEDNGWLTIEELKFSGKTGYYYPTIQDPRDP